MERDIQFFLITKIIEFDEVIQKTNCQIISIFDQTKNYYFMRQFILSTVTFTTLFFSCSDLKKKEETKKGNENLTETSNENSLK